MWVQEGRLLLFGYLQYLERENCANIHMDADEEDQMPRPFEIFLPKLRNLIGLN